MKKLGKKFIIGTAFAASIATLAGCAPTQGVGVSQVTSVDPTTEINDDVYGPPIEDFDITEETEVESTPENEFNALMYGPPEDFGITEESYETVTEINEAVYGPPPEEEN